MALDLNPTTDRMPYILIRPFSLQLLRLYEKYMISLSQYAHILTKHNFRL